MCNECITNAERLRIYRRSNPDKVLRYRMTQAARLLRRNGVQDIDEYLNGDGKR